ncbi:cytochrome c-type biogenesis protein CcmH [Alphaproteobacteria bacterium]|jgi:cytochrome c-type biogenesis protein CcmH|nr:cytochrome c-type biogenesis protein CcmH [Alphaproteobacteria bacterium]|tara:strand:- start:1103 stop:1492 length:390 start_codon:yes stop_codon:yes gene_type:complete
MKKIYLNLSLLSFFLMITSHLTFADEIIPKTNLITNKTREIAQNIKCLVCQNQSIDESNSELAKDLKNLIKEKLESGLNENEVYSFLSERYGDSILLKPPLNTNTILLWFLPFIILVFSSIYITKFFKK